MDMKFHNKIRFILRTHTRVKTYKDLADHIGVSDRFLRYLRRGERTSKPAIEKINRIYGGLKSRKTLVVGLITRAEYEGFALGCTFLLYGQEKLYELVDKLKDADFIILNLQDYTPIKSFGKKDVKFWENELSSLEAGDIIISNYLDFVMAIERIAITGKFEKVGI